MTKLSMPDTPFDSIESAHEYVTLLATQVSDVERGIANDVALQGVGGPARRLEALRLVNYKLTQLADHLAASGRILNDLRTLRRLLFAEREGEIASAT